MNIIGFVGAMVKYAKIQPFCAPDFTDKDVAEFWYNHLRVYTNEQLGNALKKLCCSHRFPSIEAIKKEIGDYELSDDEKAREISEKIYEAISKFGSIRNYGKISSFIGEIGSQVVGGAGGWLNVCDTTTYSNAGILKAQWREYAKALLKKEKIIKDTNNLLTQNKGAIIE